MVLSQTPYRRAKAIFVTKGLCVAVEAGAWPGSSIDDEGMSGMAF
jgi:hypothetical protein